MIDLGEVYAVNLSEEVDADSILEELDIGDIVEGCRDGGMYVPYTMTVHIEGANVYEDVQIEDEIFVSECDLIEHIGTTIDNLQAENRSLREKAMELNSKLNALKATIEAQEKEQALLNTICPDAADIGC